MFEDLEPFTIALICIGAFIITLWIAYGIIKAATQSSRIVELLEEQNRLLERFVGTNPEATNSEESQPPGLTTDLNDPKVLDKLLKSIPNKD